MDAEPVGKVSLRVLMGWIDACQELDPARRMMLRCGLSRTIKLIGNGLPDVELEPREVMRRLELLSPPMFGMKPRSFANLKSRVRGALRLASPEITSARSPIKLEGEWQALADSLPRRTRYPLSRLFRYAQQRGLRPAAIDDVVMAGFERYLELEVMLASHGQIGRWTRRAWNLACARVPAWPGRPVSAGSPPRTPYWVRPDNFPATLRAEMEAWLHELGEHKTFLGGATKGLAPSTLRQLRLSLISHVSAVIASGVPVESLTGFAALVRPDNVERSLRFLYRRAGDRISHPVIRVACTAVRLAHFIEAPPELIARLKTMLDDVLRDAPPINGMTEKNETLLEKFRDEALVDRFLRLPQLLKAEATMAKGSRNGRSFARDAVAVELLQTCAMRAGNLATLRLGDTLRKIGEKREARWVVDIPKEQVKNRQPLRFVLLPESVRLLDWYLATWHPEPAGSDPVWLFPDGKGGHLSTKFLSRSIAQRAHRLVGVPITCHQYRHITAELMLREDPNALAIVSQHLGHKNMQTTRNFYARSQTELAAERYQQLLTRKRARATQRSRRAGSRPGSRP